MQREDVAAESQDGRRVYYNDVAAPLHIRFIYHQTVLDTTSTLSECFQGFGPPPLEVPSRL